MRIVRVNINNFRSVRTAEFYPDTHNVLLGPNNSGKTAVLEALNLVLNPEISYRTNAVDENDFYCRLYRAPSPDPVVASPNEAMSATIGADAVLETTVDQAVVPASATPLTIRIEVVLTDLTADDEDVFREHLVPWKPDSREIIEHTAEGEDGFAGAETAIRIVFEAWLDEEEDDFAYETFFLRAAGLAREVCPRVTREHKRHIGFLIYRDFRALSRPVTLEPESLFSRLLSSQEVKAKNFEAVLGSTSESLASLDNDPEFVALINAYKGELERYLLLTTCGTSKLSFDLTDRTRRELRRNAQLYTMDVLSLPIQKMGAGTRSIALLAMLTLIMRRRGRGILALEEPETFLFPHAQRRVIDECLGLASQTFITTHSPFVLERVPIDGIGRVTRVADGELRWTPIASDTYKKCNFFSQHLRSSHCEALVGCGVVVVEGDSDRWWLTGVSRLLNRIEWHGRRQEALELAGIAVVNEDGNGDVPTLGRFFLETGLKTVGFLDSGAEPELVKRACEANFPSIFHPYSGVERLLADELSVSILRRFLAEAPHAKNLPMDAAAVVALSDVDVRRHAMNRLVENKGSAYMHSWLISILEPPDAPPSLAAAVDAISAFVAGERDIGTCSQLKVSS